AMLAMLGFLVLAATLEVGGDAAIRYGLTRSTGAMVVLGMALLAVYGLAVNTPTRSVDFGRLVGLYIVVFFVVGQLIGALLFGERPSASVWLGGALIVVGGAIILRGAR